MNALTSQAVSPPSSSLILLVPVNFESSDEAELLFKIFSSGATSSMGTPPASFTSLLSRAAVHHVRQGETWLQWWKPQLMGTETKGVPFAHSENKVQRALVLVAASTLGSCLPLPCWYKSLCLLPYGYTMAAIIPYVRLKFKARKEGGLNWIYVLVSLAKVVS